MFLASLAIGAVISAIASICWVGLSHLSLPMQPDLWVELKGVFWPVAPFAVAAAAWALHVGLRVSFATGASASKPAPQPSTRPSEAPKA